MASGSGWNLLVMLAGSGCGWNLWVFVRRNMYIDFLILLIPTLLVRICSFLQPKLTHDDHVKLLPSQLSTLIANLLEQQCYKPSGA